MKKKEKEKEKVRKGKERQRPLVLKNIHGGDCSKGWKKGRSVEKK